MGGGVGSGEHPRNEVEREDRGKNHIFCSEIEERFHNIRSTLLSEFPMNISGVFSRSWHYFLRIITVHVDFCLIMFMLRTANTIFIT